VPLLGLAPRAITTALAPEVAAVVPGEAVAWVERGRPSVATAARAGIPAVVVVAVAVRSSVRARPLRPAKVETAARRKRSP
jgi:hypothetical protein